MWSCWISFVRRTSPFRSISVTYSSQSSRGIIWNATERPFGEITGLATRSGVTITSVGGNALVTLTTWIAFWVLDDGEAGPDGAPPGTGIAG